MRVPKRATLETSMLNEPIDLATTTGHRRPVMPADCSITTGGISQTPIDGRSPELITTV